MTDVRNKRIFVGLSGGVDSSTSAAILKSEGYDVIGVFIKVWQPDFLPCTWIDDRRDAMRVAAKLGIPFMTLDLEKEYKERVVEYMVDEYRNGRTPNPDVMCNKEIKFGAFLDKALSLGADLVATGHYAQVLHKYDGVHLLKSKDLDKDQSYFLSSVPKEKLSKVLFPIGKYIKSDVRKLASGFNLATATKKDSQGLCFMGKLNMSDFLKHFIEEKAGDVLNEKGEIIGFHNGAFYLTLGQRHGFQITRKGTEERPLYIVSKDLEKNTITVSENPKGESPKSVYELERINWINEPKQGERMEVRGRYRQDLKPCVVLKEGETWKVKLLEPDIFAAGQSLVIYREEECLGGGIIKA